MEMKKRNLILLMGLALLLTSLVSGCVQFAPGQTSPTPQPPQPLTTDENQLPEELLSVNEAENGEDWSRAETFAGEGSEITPSFHIAGEKWRITWKADAKHPEHAIFDLFIYPVSKRSIFVRKISYELGNADDTVYINEGGQDYYIKVVAANLHSWTVTIEDYTTRAFLSPIQITHINYKGRSQLESLRTGYEIVESNEYVEFTNHGDYNQVIGGWVLRNISQGYPSFTFPIHLPCSCSWFEDDEYDRCIDECVPPSSCVLLPHHSFRVYTGEVHSESGGFHFYYFPGDIWNNEEPDIAALYNARGEEISRRSYIIPDENRTIVAE